MTRDAFNISALRHYMFTRNHIMELMITESTTTMENSETKEQIIKSDVGETKADENFLVPKELDKLFWCFYLMVNGLFKYEMLLGKTFEEEKAHKIQLVEELRGKKDLLKKYKWKRTVIENDLVNSKSISMNTFLCICAIKNINIVILKGRCLYVLRVDHDKNSEIVTLGSAGYGYYICDEAVKSEMFNEYTSTYWVIDNFRKPLSAISSYKLSALQDICRKLDIETTDAAGKKLKKVQLYSLIKSKI